MDISPIENFRNWCSRYVVSIWNRYPLEKSPSSPMAGNALARQGHVAEAIPCFREALRLNPDYIEARYNLGTAYLSQGQTDDAVSEFTNITQRHPEFGPAQRGLLKARELQTK